VKRHEIRQAAREMGDRGRKAKRQMIGKRQPRPKVERVQLATKKEIAEHQRRESARAAGLYIPPSAAEEREARLLGKPLHDPRLMLPGEDKR
jgi:hypothetical protein